jgi:hypothetical protein
MLVYFRQQFLKFFKIARLKATIFQKGGVLVVKPGSLIWRILLQTAGPYSGPTATTAQVLQRSAKTVRRNQLIDSMHGQHGQLSTAENLTTLSMLTASPVLPGPEEALLFSQLSQNLPLVGKNAPLFQI